MNYYLYVEDNLDNRVLLLAIMAEIFEIYQAITFEDGLDAIHFVDQVDQQTVDNLPEFALLDLSLPGAHGFEVARRIRQSSRIGMIPIMAVTAHAMPGDREQVMANGFDYYFSKPIDLREFVKVLQEIIAEHEWRKSEE